MRQTYNDFDRAISVVVGPSVPSASKGKAILSALAQLVMNKYKRSGNHALTRQEPTGDQLATLSFSLDE